MIAKTHVSEVGIRRAEMSEKLAARIAELEGTTDHQG